MSDCSRRTLQRFRVVPGLLAWHFSFEQFRSNQLRRLYTARMAILPAKCRVLRNEFRGSPGRNHLDRRNKTVALSHYGFDKPGLFAVIVSVLRVNEHVSAPQLLD